IDEHCQSQVRAVCGHANVLSEILCYVASQIKNVLTIPCKFADRSICEWRRSNRGQNTDDCCYGDHFREANFAAGVGPHNGIREGVDVTIGFARRSSIVLPCVRNGETPCTRHILPSAKVIASELLIKPLT